MRVNLLGPVEITHGERLVPLIGRHQRALVAALASEIGKVIPAGRLIDTLWGDQPPASPRTKLQGCVSAVRKGFRCLTLDGESPSCPLITREPGYLFSADGVTVDLFDYRALIQLAAHELEFGHFAEASDHLGHALGMWHGPAYADARTPVLSAMGAALEGGRLLAIERKAECDLRLGRHDEVAEELGLVLAAYPAREGIRAALMLALYRSGCRAEALESYRAGRKLLRDQIGIEPGPALRRLHELILRDDPLLATPGILAGLAGSPHVESEI
jgi:DNA-binding SARP family transcriptional activator